MKLPRKEQKEENAALDLFAAFGGKTADALKNGADYELTASQKESFRHILKRFERSERSSGVPLENYETAKEIRESGLLTKLLISDDQTIRAANFTPQEIEQLERTHELVVKIRSKARERAKHLIAGRKKLEVILRNDEGEDSQRIKEVRTGNAQTMLEKRQTADMRRGGKIGGKERKKSLTPEQRQDIASLGGSKSSRAGSPNKPKPENDGPAEE